MTEPYQPEPQPAWRKSSHSGSGGCLEVAAGPSYVHIRDSKNPDGPSLHFTHAEWEAFLAGVRDGEFDLEQP